MQQLLAQFHTALDDGQNPTEIFDDGETRTTEIDAEYLFDLAELARGAKAETVELTVQDDYPVLARFWDPDGEQIGRVAIGPRTKHSSHGTDPLTGDGEAAETTVYAVVDEAYDDPLTAWVRYANGDAVFTAEQAAREYRDRVDSDNPAVYELTARRVAGGDQ